MTVSIGPALRHQWRRLSTKPGGKWLFSRGLGHLVPYTGSLGALVQTLEPGHCVVTLRDHHRVRNHLHSIHAAALANLGEMVTGLALMNSLPDHCRGILTGLDVEYLKKARGLLTAECRCDIPASNAEHTCEVKGFIRDAGNETVASVRARWLVGPDNQ